MIICQAMPDYGGCGSPAAEVITSVCVHEHLADVAFCAEHAEMINDCYDVAERGGSQVICADCNHGPEPHHCVNRRVFRRSLTFREVS